MIWHSRQSKLMFTHPIFLFRVLVNESEIIHLIVQILIVQMLLINIGYWSPVLISINNYIIFLLESEGNTAITMRWRQWINHTVYQKDIREVLHQIRNCLRRYNTMDVHGFFGFSTANSLYIKLNIYILYQISSVI